MSAGQKILNVNTVNPLVRDIEYAVRGKVVMRAEEVDHRLKEDHEYASRVPFKRIVHCNIGNPQALKQKPITFLRQVSSIFTYPELLNLAPNVFPSDVKERAKQYLESFGSSGSYTHSKGNPLVRKEISQFIQRRDGFASDAEDIFITGGASPGVQQILNLLIRKPSDGIMIPIPQYPLYSASIPMLGGSCVPYYLNEESSWGLSIEELNRSLKEASKNNLDVRALVVINPGNPTGAVLSEENIREIIEFCHKEKLVVLADEVYQENTYTKEKKFHSFKKVLRSMPDNFQSQELVSFHSMSKGFFGECGHRGGYYELCGFEKEVRDICYKRASVNLCSNSIGQIMLGLMANPPQPGSESYDLYEKEKNDVLSSLSRRAAHLTNILNTLEGISCELPPGAMYAFPQIKIPKKAVDEANKQGLAPDALYSITALENSGIVIVPGSGFGQKEGTYHFRTTFLPPEEEFEEVLSLFKNFHQDFMKKYRE